ncbi:MAG: cupin domain-containing protein [Caulobacterales bacterium]|nr:cupin domain-containing protein [Caulobacterales bacterium]
MPKIDLDAQAPRIGTGYPAPFDAPCRARSKIQLGDAAGLTQFGANLTTLPPGAWSSQRHWHTAVDELVFIVSGEVVLVTDEGEEILRAGDAAAFRAGAPDGHHVQNRSAADAVILEIGSRIEEDEGRYPDIDLAWSRGVFTRKDGAPLP